MRQIALILALCSFLTSPSYGDVKTITYANGDKYVGKWKDDERHGQGTYTSSSGRIQKGIWKNNFFKSAAKQKP